MTYWVPRLDRLFGAFALTGAIAWAQPAQAVPVIDIGAQAGAAVHLVPSGPAVDLTADVDLRGLLLGAQYWNQMGTGLNYWQAAARYNVSPVPMLTVAPGLGVVSADGAIGPMGQLTARFSPVLLPVSVEAAAGYAFVGGGSLLPYHAGVKFSPLPFTALALKYRGWAGQATPFAGLAGPEIGIEIGI